jgi:MerR family transcriptional regulator, aldehyde-responsive regulator
VKITEAAAIAGLSPDTIRFYERSGLLIKIPRSTNGHRVFGAVELRWLNLLERLRSTGMPLTKMKEYVALSLKGAATIPERRMILESHRKRLDDQQDKIENCRALIDQKVTAYAVMEGAERINHTSKA